LESARQYVILNQARAAVAWSTMRGRPLIIPLIPNYAARKFAEDARRRTRRRTLVLQVSDNKADSTKLRAPLKCIIWDKLYFLRELGRRHGFELEEIFMPLVKMDDGSMNLTLAVEFWQALVFEKHPHNRGIMAL